jgi:hypothetical protein
MKFTLNGEAWNIKVVSPQKFQSEFGCQDMSHIGAVTMCDEQLILINGEENLTFETVLHEIVHAFYSTLCLKSANLDPSQVQEVFAEIIARRGDLLKGLSKQLFKALS